jgi:hypothetical protein
MPIHRGCDSNGCFYQWGSQKKYYYRSGDAYSRAEAKKLAIRQMVAIMFHRPPQ